MISQPTGFATQLAFAGCPLASALDARDVHGEDEAVKVSPFEQLIQLTRSNDRLLGELKRARRRLDQAIEYASDPKSGDALAITLVVHTKKNHTRVLKQLRASRFKALELLARLSNDRS